MEPTRRRSCLHSARPQWEWPRWWYLWTECCATFHYHTSPLQVRQRVHRASCNWGEGKFNMLFFMTERQTWYQRHRPVKVRCESSRTGRKQRHHAPKWALSDPSSQVPRAVAATTLRPEKIHIDSVPVIRVWNLHPLFWQTAQTGGQDTRYRRLSRRS